MSSKPILIISRYTVSTYARFFWDIGGTLICEYCPVTSIVLTVFLMLIPRHTVPETGARNWLNFSGADFGYGYVCHANFGLDSSSTRFRRRLERCSNSKNYCKPGSSMHATDMIIFYLFLFQRCKNCKNRLCNVLYMDHSVDCHSQCQ